MDFSRPTSDNKIFLDNAADVYMDFSKSVNLTPKFAAQQTSMLFDAKGMHESWEGSQEAPSELILSIASLADKRDFTEEYDVSSHPHA